MTIGERIKTLRTEKGMTQTELAELLQTTKQNIFKYENGIVTNIPSDKIEKMAEIFGIEPATLMGWAESKISAPAPLLTEHEVTVALGYRDQPAEQTAVDKLLGITEHGAMAPVRPNLIKKDIAAFGGAETLTVDSDALDAAIEKALKAKGLI